MSAFHAIKLVVFPFEDLSSQKSLEIFCRSFSEDLITELSCFRQLSIIKLSDQMPETIAPYPADYLVKGTFRSEKENFWVNVQLYNRETNHLVWGHRFEGLFHQLIEVQDDILRAVVSVLQHQIDADLLSSLKRRQKVAFTAYEHWLYGLHELKKGSLEADLKAREHFQEALRIQPDYALACSGMSLSYFNEWTCQLWDRWDISKTGAFEWAQKAMELDEQNHVIAMVLGRIYLYEGAYETAEYYFRKSLFLNFNDPDTLLPIAVYITYLGLGKDAVELYEKGMKLHPFYTGNQTRLAGFIFFELGEYEKAASFMNKYESGSARIADTDAYCAATYYYLQQYDKMEIYWGAFLSTYGRLIAKGMDFHPQEAITWLLKLNPHRHTTNLEAFLQHISVGQFEKYPLQGKISPKKSEQQNYFLKEKDIWKLSFEGIVVQMAEVKGFIDLRKLLMHPFEVFHVAELMGSVVDESGEKLIDEKARKQYQKKILELQSELQEAEMHNNFDQASKLQEEYEYLIDHLSGSLGLKGKIREKGGTVEKARSAVTWRIRNAIAKIEQIHPLLGAHLSNAVKTGTTCSYKPERTIDWITF